jgi:hypothetical protein
LQFLILLSLDGKRDCFIQKDLKMTAVVLGNNVLTIGVTTSKSETISFLFDITENKVKKIALMILFFRKSLLQLFL